MQIYCPKCNTGYQIDEKLIENKSRRLKCSNCGDIFTVESLNKNVAEAENVLPENEDPFEALSALMSEAEDGKFNISEEQEEAERLPGEEKTERPAGVSAQNEVSTADESAVVQDEKKAEGAESVSAAEGAEKDTVLDAAEEMAGKDDAEEDNVDLESIFERLSEHTEHLMEKEKKLPFYEKVWLQVKNILGFHFKIKWNYIFIGLGLFVLLSLYNNRYQVVRDVPFLNNVYKAFGIKAKIPGEGLEFQNISWDFTRNEEGAKLEVKGFIHNLSGKKIELPTIHIEILDKETSLLQSQNRDIAEDVVEPQARIPLNLVIDNPAPTAKYVYLTFIDKD